MDRNGVRSNGTQNNSRRNSEKRRVSFPETQLVTGYFEPEDPFRLGKKNHSRHYLLQRFDSWQKYNLTFCLS